MAGFQVSYCTSEAPAIDLPVAYYNSYAVCSDATVLVPTSAIDIIGAPGSAVDGSLACWIISVGLSDSTLAFQLGADQDGAYDGNSASDNFGWSFTQLTPPVHGSSGPVLAGDPWGFASAGSTGAGCRFGDGTVFAGNGSLEGTGIGTDDFVESDVGGIYNACLSNNYYTQVGNPYASLYHEIYGRAGDSPPGPGIAYCNGDGQGGAGCPCGNNNNGDQGSVIGPSGCANANSPEGGFLRATGMASVSSSTLSLTAQNIATGQPCLFFQGDARVNGGSGVPFGDGLRCAGGQSLRLQVLFSDAFGVSVTTVDLAAQGSVSAGEIKRYQSWYRNADISICGYGFNLTNGYEVAWGP